MFGRLWVVLALAGCGGDAAYKNLYTGGCALDLEEPSTRAQLVREMWGHSGARADLRAITAAPVRERGAVLAAALRRAGIETCQDRDLAAIAKPTYFGVELAVVGSTHLPAHTEIPRVRVSTRGIIVDGHDVTTIEHGVVAAIAKEGGAEGIKILGLTSAIYQVIQGTPEARIPIAFDRTLPFRVVMEVLYSVKSAGLRKFDLMVDAGGSVAAVEMTLPDKAALAVLRENRLEPRLGMFVSITKDRMVVWSMSEQEGSLKDPRHSFAIGEVDRLVAALIEIRNRRWPKGDRPVSDRQIILQLDEDVPAQRLFEIAAAVEKDPAGNALFPELVLSSGFR